MLPLEGEPVIRYTIQKALDARCFEKVYCITDSPIIQRAVADLPCQVILSEHARNGTERIAKCLDSISSSLVVNLQGDEPCFPPEVLHTFATNLAQKPNRLHILVRPEANEEILCNPNRVKVRWNSQQDVQAFTRTYNPNQERPQGEEWGVQLGVYGYSKALLHEYMQLPPSVEEQNVSHEILRWNPLPPTFAQVTQSHPLPLDTDKDWSAIQKAYRKLNL
jgi:3-deoxy-manno-octulosonate cytidylyltransferase (CMP-KDO synthetase)